MGVWDYGKRKRGGRTAGIRDTGNGMNDVPIEFASVLRRLKEFPIRWRVIVLEVRFNRLVLFVELGKVRNEVLDDVHCKRRKKSRVSILFDPFS